MRTALSVLVACWCLGLFAQGFNKRYDAFGQGNYQGAFGIEKTTTGFLVFAASYEPDTVTLDSLLGIHSIILDGIDVDGGLLSEQRHKKPQHSLYLGAGNCCDSVAGGGYITGGTVESLALEQHVRLIRYNASGDTLWTRDFGDGTHFWGGEQVRTLSDGGFMIGGFTDATGDVDGFVIRTDSSGNELWWHTYGWGNPIYIDAIVSVDESVSGELYMSGTRYLSEIDGQHWIQRTNPDGLVAWSVSWGGPFKEGDTGLAMLSDGYPLVAGSSGIEADYAAMRPYLAKIDTIDGSRMWEREYGAAVYSTLFFTAKQNPNSDIIAAGVTYEGGHEQGLLLRSTSAGDSLWMRKYWYHDDTLDQGQGRFYDVLPTDDGGFIAAGFANGSFNGPLPPGYSQDAWVVKVDSMGCMVPGCDGVGVPTIITNMGDALNVYPNPVRDQLHVGIKLPANFKTEGPLTVSVITMEGKVLRQEPVPSSSPDELVVDVSGLAAGTYTVHLSDAQRWIAGKKFVVE